MVGDQPRRAVEIVTEVARVATMVGTLEDRAQALLEPLRRVVPFQQPWIAVLDPHRNAYVSLAAPDTGPEANLALASSPAAVEATERIGLHASTRPVFGRERAVPLSEDPNWARLWPAGFRDEIAVGLHVGGVHMGALALLTETSATLTEPVRDLIGALAPLISKVVDPMATVAAAARLVGDARAGVLIAAATGAPLPLPGLPGHPLLAPESPVLAAVAAQLAAGNQRPSFLSHHADPTTGPGLVRITGIPLPASPVRLSAVVTVSPPGDLSGLTSRELQILGMVIEGWGNRRIAAQLLIAFRTVATHMEHILVKLVARNRTEAAVRALRRQLYIPAALGATRGHPAYPELGAARSTPNAGRMSSTV